MTGPRVDPYADLTGPASPKDTGTATATADPYADLTGPSGDTGNVDLRVPGLTPAPAPAASGAQPLRMAPVVVKPTSRIVAAQTEAARVQHEFGRAPELVTVDPTGGIVARGRPVQGIQRTIDNLVQAGDVESLGRLAGSPDLSTRIAVRLAMARSHNGVELAAKPLSFAQTGTHVALNAMAGMLGLGTASEIDDEQKLEAWARNGGDPGEVLIPATAGSFDPGQGRQTPGTPAVTRADVLGLLSAGGALAGAEGVGKALTPLMGLAAGPGAANAGATKAVADAARASEVAPTRIQSVMQQAKAGLAARAPVAAEAAQAAGLAGVAGAGLGAVDAATSGQTDPKELAKAAGMSAVQWALLGGATHALGAEGRFRTGYTEAQRRLQANPDLASAVEGARVNAAEPGRAATGAPMETNVTDVVRTGEPPMRGERPSAPATPPEQAYTDLTGEAPATAQPRPTLRRRLAEAIDPNLVEERRAAEENARQLEEDRRRLQREKETDKLTGLGNRDALDRALPAAEADPQMGVATFDANNFGQVNKKKGHAVGDQYIRDIAGAIQRAADDEGGAQIFRRGTGGDEFVVIAPHDQLSRIVPKASELFGERDLGDGVIVSLTGTHGNTFADADAQLQEAKTARKAAQAARAQQPTQPPAEPAAPAPAPASEGVAAPAASAQAEAPAEAALHKRAVEQQRAYLDARQRVQQAAREFDEALRTHDDAAADAAEGRRRAAVQEMETARAARTATTAEIERVHGTAARDRVSDALSDMHEQRPAATPPNPVTPPAAQEPAPTKKKLIPTRTNVEGVTSYKLADEPTSPASFDEAHALTNDDGSPMTVYHGTRAAPFTEFKVGTAEGWGRGIYLTDNKAQAAEEFGHGGRVVSAQVSMKKPYRDGIDPVPSDAAMEGTQAWAEVKGRYDTPHDAWEDSGAFAGQVLRELGYDGIIGDRSNNIDGKEIVAFDPSQVRIVDQGTSAPAPATEAPAAKKLVRPERYEWWIGADDRPRWTTRSDAEGYRGPFTEAEVASLTGTDPSYLAEGKKHPGQPVYTPDYPAPSAPTTTGNATVPAKFDTPEIRALRERAAAIEPPADTPERQAWRVEQARSLAQGASRFERRADLVLGLPGAGKTSTATDPLVEANGSVLLDADRPKENDPSGIYQNGLGAGALHAESAAIRLAALEQVVPTGANLVYPTIGDPTLTPELVRALQAQGYTVHVHLVDVPPDVAAQRAVERFQKSVGHFVDPAHIFRRGEDPRRGFAAAADLPGVIAHAPLDNTVPHGTAPRPIEDWRERFGLDATSAVAGDTRPAAASDAQAGRPGRGSGGRRDVAPSADAATEAPAATDVTDSEATDAGTTGFARSVRPGVSGQPAGASPRGVRPGEAGGDVGPGRQGGADASRGEGAGGVRRAPGAASEPEGLRESGATPDDARVAGEGAGDGRSRRPARGEGAAPAQRVEREATRAPAQTNYELTPTAAAKLLEGGAVTKAKANLAALRLLKEIEAAGRPATIAEQDILSRYTGWGGMPQAFDETHKGYASVEGPALRELLTDEEWEAARASTPNAHYTSPEVIAGVHRLLGHLGFTGGRILEPSMGAGYFLGMTPEAVRSAFRWTGVELDSVTGRIAKLLYPAADVHVMGFQDLQRPDGFFDMAVGNVPFGNYKVHDPRYNKLKLSIHNYFFRKSLDLVRPGGLVAYITSAFTMDARSTTARAELAKLADLVGAIRLPGDAFKGIANTDVTTDLIVLRKRAPGQAPAGEPWTSTKSVRSPVPGKYGDVTIEVNEYFLAHPEHILGELRGDGTMNARFGDAAEMRVKSTGPLAPQLDAAIQRFPAGAYRAAEVTSPASKAPGDLPIAEPQVAPDEVRDYGLTVGEGGTILQRRAGVLVDAGVPKSATERVTKLIQLRDLTKAALNAQIEDRPEAEIERTRKALDKAYTAFVRKYGPILKETRTETKRLNPTTGEPVVQVRTPNLQHFTDGEKALVLALEHYDPESGTAEKGDILVRRVYEPRKAVARVDTPNDALPVVLAEAGRVDLQRIAQLSGVTPEDAAQALRGLIFEDHAAPGTWKHVDEYTTGDVKTKLAELAPLAKADPARWGENLKALEAAIPEDLPPSKISARLGAPWIPTSDIERFAIELLGAGPVTVSYTPAGNIGWRVEGGWQAKMTPANTTEFGTRDRNALDLIETALNLKTPTVYDPPDSDGKRAKNAEKTLAAQEKMQRIQDRFERWVWEDGARADRLARLYNDRFNRIRNAKYDGSHLTLPGSAAFVKGRPFAMRPHQLNFVWRAIVAGNTLAAHVVGSGKAQPLDAKVLTPTGWRRMGDLRIGDEVIARDGTATPVVGVYPQGAKPIYRVLFSDGSSTECCDEHLWRTQTYRERGYAQRAKKIGKEWPCAAGRVRALAEIRETLTAAHLGAKNHSIPLVEPVQFAERAVPLDPYLLGVLLGDGCFRGSGVMLSTSDVDLLGLVSAVLPADCELRYRSGADFSIVYTGAMAYAAGGGAVASHPVKSSLVRMGLWGTYSHEKRVPADYLYNTVDARLALLRGLMDTDGTVEAKGTHTTFCTTSPGLADDVVALVRSLGGIATTTVKQTAFRPATTVTLTMPAHLNPFALPRKALAVQPKTRYVPARYIVAVEPVGEKPAQCIAVAHPEHLYVTDDFIVTHNTFTMIAAGMEQKRLGLVRKPLYVVPNHMLDQFSTEFKQLYPAADLLLATKDDFAKAERQAFVARAATNNWDAIIMTHRSFESVPMSDAFQEQFIRQQLMELEEAIREAKKAKSERALVKQIEKAKFNLEAKLEKMMAEGKKDQLLSFEQMGVDQVFVDEADVYKNLMFSTKLEGVSAPSSERAFDLFLKSMHLEQVNPGRGLIFATGTPIANAVAEMFTMQRYLQPGALAQRGLSGFDAWAATFGKTVTGLEMKPDNSGFRLKTRFASYDNVGELAQMFRAVTDVQTAEDLDLPRPALKGGAMELNKAPATFPLRAYVKNLAKRGEAVQSRKVDPTEDNWLKITSDGRRAALDMRLVDATAMDLPESKVNMAVDRIHEIWERTKALKGAQLVFSDLSTPGSDPGPQGGVPHFNVYDDIKTKLVAKGVPAKEVRFIHDAKTDEAKKKLFADVRAGRVRVLLGSTEKMGAGTNVQDRLVALHNLDAPWRPRDIEQRHGRILRQGNVLYDTGKIPHVEIHTYVTEGSFDGYIWQSLERKAAFIRQALTADAHTRSIEDVGEVEIDWATAKAIASGNPMVKDKAEVDAKLGRLERLERAHRDEQFGVRKELQSLPAKVEGYEREATATAKDVKALVPTTGDQFTITVHGATLTKRADAGTALQAAVQKAAAEILTMDRGTEKETRLGRFAGLDLSVVARRVHNTDTPEMHLLLRGAGLHYREVSANDSATSLVAQLEAMPHAIEKRSAQLTEHLAATKQRLAAMQAKGDVPFEHATELTDLRAKQRDLEAALKVSSDIEGAGPERLAELLKEAEAGGFDTAAGLVRDAIAAREKAAQSPTLGPSDAERDGLAGGAEDVDALFSPSAPGTPLGAATARVRGTARRVEAAQAKDVKSLAEIARTLASMVDVPLRQGRFLARARRAAGAFFPQKEVARVLRFDRLETVAHEIGHYLSHKYLGQPTRLGAARRGAPPMSPAVKREFTALGKALYGSRKPKGGYGEEGIAEWAKLYVTDPERLAAEAPNAAQWVHDHLLAKEPALKAAMDQARQDFADYQAAPADARVDAMIDVAPSRRFLPDPRTLPTHYIDDLYEVRRAVEELGSAVSPARNAYLLSRLTRGGAGLAEEMVLRGVIDPKTGERVTKGVAEVLAKLPKRDVQRFRRYLVAERTLEVAGRGIDTGISVADARTLVDKYGARFRPLAEDLWAISNALIDYRVAKGLLTPEEGRTIKQKNRRRVGFYRVFADDETAASRGHGRGFGRNSSGVLAMKGSARKIIDPLESMLTDVYRTVQQSHAADVLQALVEQADRTPGGGRVIEILTEAPKRPVRIRVDDVKEQLAELGVELPDAGLGDMPGVLTAFETLSQAGPKEQKDLVRPLVIKGQRKWIQIKDAPLYNALAGLGTPQMTALMRFLSIPTRTLRAGATLTLEFVARNPVRDAWSAAIYSRAGTRPPGWDLARGLFHVLKQDQMYQDWRLDGGDNAAMLALDRVDVKKHVKQLMRSRPEVLRDWVIHPIDTLRLLSSLTENATRVGEYVGVRRKLEGQGMAPEDARVAGSLASRDVTIDFARSGDYMRAVNQIIAFSNANAQGWDKLYRELKQNPQTVIPRLLAFITIPSLLLYLWQKDDPAYQEVPRWQKIMAWVIVDRDAQGNVKHIWRIPKPPDLGILFGSVPELIAQYANDHNGGTALKGALEALSNLNPVHMPNALGPIVEWWANKSFFTDHAIVPEGLANLPAAEQSTDRTGELARQIGQPLHLSPAKIENTVRGYTGGLGTYGMDLGNVFLREGREALGLPALKPPGSRMKVLDDGPASVPLIKGFAVRTPQMDAQSIQDALDAYQSADAHRQAWKHKLSQGDAAGARGYFAKHEAAIRSVATAADRLGAVGVLKDAHDLIVDAQRIVKDADPETRAWAADAAMKAARAALKGERVSREERRELHRDAARAALMGRRRLRRGMREARAAP